MAIVLSPRQGEQSGFTMKRRSGSAMSPSECAKESPSLLGQRKNPADPDANAVVALHAKHLADELHLNRGPLSLSL